MADMAGGVDTGTDSGTGKDSDTTRVPDDESVLEC
jgi:hypothetical protein